MGWINLPLLGIALCCAISAGVAARLDYIDTVERTTFKNEEVATESLQNAVPPTTSDWQASGEEHSEDSERVASIQSVRTSVPTQPIPEMNTNSWLKTSEEIQGENDASKNYVGPSKPGVSRSEARANFWRLLRERVKENVDWSIGGIIEEFGTRDSSAHTCDKRPSLTITQVRDLARTSFGIPDFEVSHPPCDGVGERIQCIYDTGYCCRRPQTEFVGRYYDTAVAAMALGATREEAFAPLIHARTLAYTLQTCDPGLNFKGHSARNDIGYITKEVGSDGSTNVVTKYARESDLSLIAFPVSYEVLYELYNTMLIERMRSRGNVQIPSEWSIRKINDRLYYRKLITRICPLDRELDPDIMFPNARDFQRSGLTMSVRTSLGIANVRTADESSARQATNVNSSELHPRLRFSSTDSISVYETTQSRWRSVSYSGCNQHMSAEPFYPFRFQTHVSSWLQGCCAKECHFMAYYGGTFSTGSANCCSGCNRYGCSANTEDIANILAELSTVEAPSKDNLGLEEMSLCV